MNVITIIGRLTAKPVLAKTNTNNKSVCSASVAVDSGYGESKKTDFFNVVFWNKTAESVCQWCDKGSLIAITGSMNSRKFTDKNGYDRTAWELTANQVKFLDSAKPKAEQEEQPEQFTTADIDEFQPVIDSTDGDLPF